MKGQIKMNTALKYSNKRFPVQEWSMSMAIKNSGIICWHSHPDVCTPEGLITSTSVTCVLLNNLHFANQHTKYQKRAVSDKNSSQLTSVMNVKTGFSLVKLKVLKLCGLAKIILQTISILA